MATRTTSLLLEETDFCAVLDQAQPISREAWTSLYTAHYRHVLQICRRFFRQPEDAEDAAAEVFLKLHRVAHKKNVDLPFRPWVSQVAGHHCIDKLRQRKREKSSSLEEVDLSGLADHSIPSPLSQILHNDRQRQVREQLTRLPEKYKVPLVLRYYKRMSYSQIARALNSRLPVVRMMIFRGKDQLRRNLKRLQPERAAPASERYEN